MAAKQKVSIKRGNDHLKDITSNCIEASEITICRSKRRKNGNGEVINTGNQEVVETQLQSHGQVAPFEFQQKCSNKHIYLDSEERFPVVDASSTEKCVRNRYKNTYASLSKTSLLSNQIKNKQYIDGSNVVLIKTTNDVEHKSGGENNKGKETQKLEINSINRSPTVSNNIEIPDSDKLCNNFTQVIDSNSILSNKKGSLVYVQSPSLPSGKTRTYEERSCLKTVKTHQFSEPECFKEKCNTLDSIISSELESHINHSENSLLKPVAKVSAVSTISSVPTLSANTSAITAISTPIPTFPKLPDVFGDMLKGEAESLEKTSLTSRRKDVCSGSTLQEMDSDGPGCSSVEVSKQNNCLISSCSQNVHHNQLRCTDPSTSATLPVVDIRGESGDSYIKEEDCASLSNDVSDTKAKIHALGTITSSTSDGSSFLQVDTWATHMLQNLELLYKNEIQCDFILKFCGGEILKVHRTILLACTSLVSEADPVLDKNELVVPADLNFASVEPVIRFIYTGRLEIQKSTNEMSAIYAAAKRFEVSLLTHIMDHHFPYLQYNFYSLTSLRDSKKEKENKQQFSAESNSFATLLSKDFPQSLLEGKSSTSKNTLVATLVENEQNFNSKTFQETNFAAKVDMEECETPDSSVYYLVTNSRNHSYTSSPERSKKITEEARPTRFQLEEDSEKLHFNAAAAAWNTKISSASSPDVPLTLGTSNLTHTPKSSPALMGSTSSETYSCTTSSPSQVFKKCLSSSDVKVQKKNPHLICHLSHEDQIIESINSSNQNLGLGNDIDVPIEYNEYNSVVDIHNNHHSKGNEFRKQNEELMEKISSICRQLEEKESNDANELQETNINREKSNEKLNLLLINNKTGSKEASLTKGNLMSNAIIPVKSILKKNKNKSHVNKETKHVSFQMDENNELINEVATFSLSKEPAQSLIQVQKTKGNTKSRNDTHSPVKLTVSMKKKVLMNLALSESDTIGSSSLQVKRSHGKKGVSSSSQGYSKSNMNKGDITNHAKIISEVLKKYPHLVKDKKKIRLKILKKGNEKEGGKMKSKVQYLVLSDGDAKSKSVTKVSKTSSLSKHNLTTAQAALSQRSFECPECANMTFKSYFLLKKHVFLSHKDKSNAILSQTENVPYACYKCFANEPLEFDNYYTYQQHMGEVHSKSELRLCNICGFKPRRKIELAYHQHTQHNKISKSFCFPKCDLCDHIAINDAALLKHRSQHRNADNYTCSVCGVKFCSFGALQGHMQTKLCQTKPSVSHKCPHCPMTFARSYNLKAHCKSSHKSLQTPSQSIAGVREMQSQDMTPHSTETQSQEAERNSDIRTNSNSNYEKNNTNAEVDCETLTVVDAQSSEAEALSTVANSLVASLRLPEETINQYMYSQDNKMDYSNTEDGAKVEQVISKPLGLSVHLEIPSVSEYQDQSQGYDKPYNIHTSVQDGTSISSLFPISVLPNEVLPSLVPRHIVPSHILQAGCMNPTSAPVLGTASQSWTYVTYQVPSSSDDLPGVFTETTSIIASPEGSHHSTNTENVYRSTSTNIAMNPSNISCTESTLNTSGEHATVTVTDTQTTRNQTSSLPVTHTYDSLPSQFV